MNKVVLACRGIDKVYVDGHNRVPVLQQCQLTVEAGERIAIMGRSGAGKSTLLHCLGGLDTPSAGEVVVHNQVINRMRERQRARLRNRSLGFIYQFHHLLPEFTAVENVAMPLFIAKVEPQQALARAKSLLTQVGLADRIEHKPTELSGGERQRVAIARALANAPQCVLADEPTGNLDNQTADQVFEVMMQLNRQHQTSMVIATHDVQLARKMDRVYQLESGQLAPVQI